MNLCACPAATTLTTIPAATCSETFGQIQKAAFCRLAKADGTKNSFTTGSSTGIDKLAAWTAKMAKTDGEKIVGVCIVGRPVSRYLDDGMTLEVTRCCTDGTRNACSILYAAAWRAAKAMGYKKIITYILKSENGASLRASGYKCIGECGGLRWTGKRKPEVDLYPAQMKLRFEKEC